MAYTTTNFKTKKSLKEALEAAQALNKMIRVYQPNADLTGAHLSDGQIIVIEGPHYPEPHRWYARARIRKELTTTGEEIFFIEKILG